MARSAADRGYPCKKQTDAIDFLDAQEEYAQLAQDEAALTMPDKNGRVPLHHALHCQSRRTVKLLVAGNPAALKIADKYGDYHPLHCAAVLAL